MLSQDSRGDDILDPVDLNIRFKRTKVNIVAWWLKALTGLFERGWIEYLHIS